MTGHEKKKKHSIMSTKCIFVTFFCYCYIIQTKCIAIQTKCLHKRQAIEIHSAEC